MNTPESTAASPSLSLDGPDHAEQALRDAYNRVLESGLTYFWERYLTAGVNANEAQQLYQQAFHAFEHNHRLLAERWGRAASHFALALWHEAKIQFLTSPACPPIPSLRSSASPPQSQEELHLHTHETSDEIESEISATWVQSKRRVGRSSQGENDPFFLRISRYLTRAEHHLSTLIPKLPQNFSHTELLQVERLKAAHEYASAAEYLLLAWDWALGEEKQTPNLGGQEAA